MRPHSPLISTLKGGSSSSKFALYETRDPLVRNFRVMRLMVHSSLKSYAKLNDMRVTGARREDNFSRLVAAQDHIVAVSGLIDWIEDRLGGDVLMAIGHRVVHGGPKYSNPTRITAQAVRRKYCCGDRLHSLPAAFQIGACGDLYIADWRPRCVHCDELRGDQREHHVARGHRYRHRRDGRRGHCHCTDPRFLVQF